MTQAYSIAAQLLILTHKRLVAQSSLEALTVNELGKTFLSLFLTVNFEV